ncbi:hypothetical protein A2165_00600 [Candidatus Curtissbacteria bacterium RBG_13_40_7]|uniref:Uncharacterized protein n=1 Tax=Candidatus Curtissbacteria bacterium RBG_13_40_7 TaxID=1797706 RepID=A0A1F5FU03_9BACT|nr:MAG: hypothetical protein A2165_00600 [Candidatus Curtissbacteria bacterium RBG_13_40_7]
MCEYEIQGSAQSATRVKEDLARIIEQTPFGRSANLEWWEVYRAYHLARWGKQSILHFLPEVCENYLVTRVIYALARGRIVTKNDIASMNFEDLSGIEGIGSGSLPLVEAIWKVAVAERSLQTHT